MTGPPSLPDLLVIGGGVIGLAAAREAARRGLRVCVVDRGEPGREASWAAAGMLSPIGEAEEAGPLLELALWSLGLYPSWAAAIEEESGIPVGYRERGKLRVALSDAEAEGLRRRVLLARAGGVPADWLDAGETRAIEPSLTDAVRASLLIHREVQVDARSLARALLAATRGAGVEILPGREAKGIRWRDGAVEGVQLADGSVMRGRRVLLAAGAWSGTLEGLPLPLPVRPVKGQMLSVEPDRLALDRVVESDDVYLVPTADRGILIGATVEEVGFDKSNTEEGLRGLLASATGLYPALEGATVLETWAGLRPGTPDGLPVIGTFPGKEGLLAATGHHRNGILLAPATARAIVSLLTDPTATPVPSELSPARFAPRPISTAHDP